MILHADHVCDMPDDDNDILLLPGRGPIRKMWYIFRLSLLASRKNPAAHKYLRSNASIGQEKRRHWRNYTSIIHPFSMFRYTYIHLRSFHRKWVTQKSTIKSVQVNCWISNKSIQQCTEMIKFLSNEIDHFDFPVTIWW